MGIDELTQRVNELEAENAALSSEAYALQVRASILYEAVRAAKHSIEEGWTFQALDEVLCPRLEAAMRLVGRVDVG